MIFQDVKEKLESTSALILLDITKLFQLCVHEKESIACGVLQQSGDLGRDLCLFVEKAEPSVSRMVILSMLHCCHSDISKGSRQTDSEEESECVCTTHSRDFTKRTWW